MKTPYRVLGYTLLPLLRWRISRVEGLEHLPPGGFIAAPNHQSWIDSALVAAALYQNIPKSLRFVAQSSKYRIFGGIPIDEYDKSKVLDIADGYLEVGHPIIIFPEGNSNKNPELRTGKTGVARLALRSGKPVVPIGIIGTQGVKAWQALGWWLQWWKRCVVRIGAPIAYPAEPVEDREHRRLFEVTQSIMEKISQVSGKPLSPTELREEPHVHQPWLTSIVRKMIYPMNKWRVRIQGAEHLPQNGPFILAPNHMSYYDGPALTIALLRARNIQPFYPTKAAVAEAFRGLLGQGGLDALGLLPLDQTDRSRVLRHAEAHLHAGGVVAIFPEGTRNKPRLNPEYPRTMLKGKTGVTRLWLDSHAPVIPVAIQAPEGLGIWQSIINVLAFWKRMVVTFGQPVVLPKKRIEEITKPELDDMTRTIMHAIGRLSGQSYTF